MRKYHNKDQTHENFPHGKFAGYRAGCKCGLCMQANRDKKREYNRQLRETNKQYAANQAAYRSLYRQTEKGKASTLKQDYVRRIKKAECRDKQLINKIYQLCPPGFEVDHIVPLSKNGKHEPNNLQYLPKHVNRKKSNRIDCSFEDAAIKWQTIIGTFND